VPLLGSALLGVAAVWGLAGALCSGIGVGPDGVTVRSALGRSTRVPWPELVGFQVQRLNRWNSGMKEGTLAVAVTCRDGRTLTTSGCYFMPWTNQPGSKSKLDEMLRALEAERAAAEAGPPAPTGVS
jgi:hypothetical protein